jgi:hypothetical protein
MIRGKIGVLQRSLIDNKRDWRYVLQLIVRQTPMRGKRTTSALHVRKDAIPGN